jgi:hypothetical protein
LEFEKGVYKTYHIPDTWQIAVVRAEEDKITVECADGVYPFWFTEKACPPTPKSADRLREAAKIAGPGTWGKPSGTQALTIQTRAKTAAAAKTSHPAAAKATVALSLPAKSVADASGVQKASVAPVFKPNPTVELVPGQMAQLFASSDLMNCRLRQGDLAVKAVDLRILVSGEGERCTSEKMRVLRRFL